MVLQFKEPTNDNVEEVAVAENGQFTEEEVEQAIPNSICWLYNLSELCNCDSSGIGKGND